MGMYDSIQYEKKVVDGLNAKTKDDENVFNNRFNVNKINNIYDDKRKCFNKNYSNNINKNDKLVFLFQF